MALLLFWPGFVSGQFYDGYQMEFGRSRVQFKDFLWTYYKFDRFDTYFYLNGKELAVHTAKYASTELERMELRLGAFFEGKIQFIIFNNLNDLKQSNIGLSAGMQYNTGGVSYILDNKVALYFDGSISSFERQIRQGIAHVLLQNAVFGSNISSQVMNSFVQNFPEWFATGLILYLAEEWNTDIDNRMRNIILSGRYKKFNRLMTDELRVNDAAHSFWKFIADRYGSETVASVLNMVRVSRNVDTGFQYVLGVSLKTLYSDWYDHYAEIYNEELERFDEMPDEQRVKGRRVLKRNADGRHYDQFEISPDGQHFAFVTNETGKYRVWLQNTQTGRLRRIHTGGYRLDEKVDYTYPILSWHPSGRILSMVIEEKGLIQLYFYDIEERDWSSRNLFGFEKILDFSYSHNGQLLLLSAVQEGQSDLFTFNLISGSYERLTNDIYDDLSPRFIDNSARIIFSSNRPGDTLQKGEKHVLGKQTPGYNIFIYDYATRDPALRRVTDNPFSNEIQPMQYGKNHFAYLSDESGIYNRHVGRLDSAVAYVDTIVHYRYFTSSFPVTNYPRSIHRQQISPRAGRSGIIIDYNLRENLYKEDLLLPERLSPTEPGRTNFIASLFPDDASDISPEMPVTPGEIRPPDREPTRTRRSFRNVMRGEASEQTYIYGDDEPPTDTESIPRTERQGILDINMPDTVNAMQQRFDTTKTAPDEPEFVIPVQRNYYTQYSINQLVTQIDFTYLNQTYQPFSSATNPRFNNPGLSPTFKVGLTDLMEDYRIMGGMRIGLDLVDKEFFLNYANLKGRLDKEFIFQHRNIEQTVFSAFVQRQRVNEGFFVLTWPFNRVFRIKNTFLFRNETYIIAGPDELVLREPNLIQNWGGAKVQLIYDDSRELSMNILQGSRFMIFGEYNQLVEDSRRNLIVLGFDFRNYHRIHRHFIWANRLAGSTNFGNDRLIYFMGGTDGAFFPTFEQDTRIDPDVNWAYQTLATNMRGFNQNARNGANFVVFNSELRFPVFTYLLNRPINSELLRHFQLVGFGDVGTAWTGWNPWDENNVLFTKYESFGPLRIKVQYEKEPIIGGTGFGIRTKLLGYFMKLDMAWGIEDGTFAKKPKFHFSMSLDF